MFTGVIVGSDRPWLWRRPGRRSRRRLGGRSLRSNGGCRARGARDAHQNELEGEEEKHRRPGGTIYLSDGHLDLALIHTEKYPWGIHHFGFKVDSVKEIEKIADTKAEDNTYGAIAESWIKDAEGNRVDVSEHGWPI